MNRQLDPIRKRNIFARIVAWFISMRDDPQAGALPLRWVRGVDVMDMASPVAFTATAARPGPWDPPGVPATSRPKKESRNQETTVLNQRNERRIRMNRAASIESPMGLRIDPGGTREQKLRAVDSALTRIEGILAELGEGGTALTVSDSRFAFRQFMDRLRGPLSGLADRIEVIENAAFMQIRSRLNGHRVYISKGKLVVGRVDSTLPLGLIPGAVAPTHHNGNIRSWIPADVESVSRAIELLGMERLPPVN